MAKVDRKLIDKAYSDLDSEIQEDINELLSFLPDDDDDYDWRNDDLYQEYYHGDY